MARNQRSPVLLQTSSSYTPSHVTSYYQPKQASANLPEQILEQVHFWFSDENLTNDTFLSKKIAEGQDGFVPLDLIANFPKLKRISNDINAIRDSLKKSTHLELSEDGQYLRRREAFHTGISGDDKDSLKKTIFVLNVPSSICEPFTLTSLFSIYGTIRRTDIKLSRVEIEFEQEHQAKRAMMEFQVPQNIYYQMGVRVKPAKTEESASSIYAKEPQFHYNQKTRGKKARSNSFNHPEDKWEATHKAQRPKLNLNKPSSDGGASISPIRQPKGPDGTNGFAHGRGKLVKN